MEQNIPSISKEQYESLLKLTNQKEPAFCIESKQNIFGDSLSVFLKEYSASQNKLNNKNTDVNFYNLLERFS